MCKNFNVSASVRVDCGFFAVGVRILFLQLRLDSKRLNRDGHFITMKYRMNK